MKAFRLLTALPLVTTCLVVSQGPAGAAESAKWPQAPGAMFALRNGEAATPVIAFDTKGRELMAFNCAPSGRALFGRFYDLVCAGGFFQARDAGPWIGMQVAKSGAFTLEATLTPAEAQPKSPGVVLAFANEAGEDLALLQDQAGLSLRLRGRKPIDLFAVEKGKPVHVLFTCDKGKWVAYREGKAVRSGSLAAEAPAWGTRELLLGAGWAGTNSWRGRMEAVAVFARALSAEEAGTESAAAKAVQAGRKPATPVVFRGTLARQAKTADLESIRPYTRSLTAAEYKVDKVIAGKWDQPTITVLHWMIMDRKRLPIADRQPGVPVELSVEPVGEHPQLESCRRDDEIDGEIAADLFYCESEPDAPQP